jgi:hypothetical protein
LVCFAFNLDNMDDRTIFTKTAKGLGEAVGKTKLLSRDARKVIKEVDGKASFMVLIDRLDGMSDDKLLVILRKLIADDYVREFNPPAVTGEDESQIPAEAEIEDALSVLTMGAFLREMEQQPESTGKKDKLSRNTETRNTQTRNTQTRNPQTKILKEKIKTDAEESFLRAKKMAEEQALKLSEQKSKREAEQKAQQEAQAKAKAEQAAQERARQEAQAKKEAEQKAQQEAQAKAKVEQAAEAKAKTEQAAQEQKDAEEQAKRDAETKARQEAQELAQLLEQVQKDAEEEARRAAEIQAEAKAKAEQEAEELVRQQERQKEKDAEDMAWRKFEARAKKEADQLAREKSAALEKKLAEEKIIEEARELARQKEQEQLQKQAQEQAQREVEQKAAAETLELARQAEQAQIKQAAEEQAQREAELAAETQALELAMQAEQAQIKQAAQEQAQHEAEQEAQAEALELARQAEQAQLKQAAQEQAQREAEQKAVEEALQSARQAEQARAEKEATALALKAAEEKAQQEAQQEQDARALLEAEAQAKKDYEEHIAQEVAETLRRKVEDQEQRDEDERAHQAVMLELAQLEEQERERLHQENIKIKEQQAIEHEAELAKEEKIRLAQALAEKKVEDRARQRLEQKRIREAERKARKRERDAASSSRQSSYASSVSWMQIALGASVIFIAVLLGWAQWSNFDDRLLEFEKNASAQFQQPVKITELHFGFMPEPHWQFGNVTIGVQRQIKIERVNAVLDLPTLFDQTPAFKSVELVSPVVNQEGLGWLLFGKVQQPGLRVHRVKVNNAKLDWPELNLGLFDGLAELGASGAWHSMELDSSNKEMHIELQPKDGLVQVKLNQNKFAVPFGSALTLDHFSAEGSLSSKALELTKFYGVLQDGTLTGAATINWANGWTMKGDVTAKQIKAALGMPSLFESGQLEGSGRFFMQARQPEQLFNSARLNGNFSVLEGTLLGVNLVNLMQGVDSAGTSAFDKITGSFTYQGGRTSFRNVSWTANLVSVNGDADLNAKDQLSGRFVVALTTPSRAASSDLLVSGTLKKPQFSK